MKNDKIWQIAQRVFSLAIKNPANKNQFINNYLQEKKDFENKESWESRLWKFAQFQKLPPGWDIKKFCNFVYDNRESF